MRGLVEKKTRKVMRLPRGGVKKNLEEKFNLSFLSSVVGMEVVGWKMKIHGSKIQPLLHILSFSLLPLSPHRKWSEERERERG